MTGTVGARTGMNCIVVGPTRPRRLRDPGTRAYSGDSARWSGTTTISRGIFEPMTTIRADTLPATVEEPGREVSGAIERVIADVPRPRTHQVSDPASDAAAIAKRAAKQAALLSGTLALPPGPLGMLTVLPDLFLIWKTQRQMVADIFGLYGRSAELTRVHMLYCLFRHAASHVLRDFVVRTGQRVIVQQLTAGALQGIVQGLVTRWIGLVFIAYFKADMKLPPEGLANLARREWQRLTAPTELVNFLHEARQKLQGR